MVDGKQPGLPNVVFDRHAHVFLGGKSVELYYFGRGHTNGDAVVYFPAYRLLAGGDLFAWENDFFPLVNVDYAGGGSMKEFVKTVDEVLKLDYATVIPGHGPVGNKKETTRFREQLVQIRNRIHQMSEEKKSRDEIGKMLVSEFHWQPFFLDRSLDGSIAETR